MTKKIIITAAIFIPVSIMLWAFHFLASQKQAPKEQSYLSEQEWQALANHTATVYRGKVEYQLRCYKCHGGNLRGTYRGVSLVDDEWRFGSSYQDIYNTIYHGNGAMMGYGKKLLDSDIQAITVFIKSQNK